MKSLITFERIAMGMWRVTYRGYIAPRHPTPLTGLYEAWRMCRHDHRDRKIKWGEIPGQNGRSGLQIQWAPRRWILFYRLGGGRLRAVWTKGVAPFDLAAADDYRFDRFDRFAATTRDRVTGEGSPYQLRTDSTLGPWQEFPELPADPGDDPAAS